MLAKDFSLRTMVPIHEGSAWGEGRVRADAELTKLFCRERGAVFNCGEVEIAP